MARIQDTDNNSSHNLPASKMEQEKLFTFTTKQISSHLKQGTITINSDLVTPIRQQIMVQFAKKTTTPGLTDIPLAYIEQNYKKEIYRHTKNFLYRYLVIDFLAESIIKKKLIAVNHPRLIASELLTTGQATFTFDLSVADQINIREWKHFIFKAPRRKNYKDLDKQVNLFIKHQQELVKKNSAKIIQETDWVGMRAIISNEQGKPTSPPHENRFWIRISSNTIRHPLISFLLGKGIGDSFISNKLSLNSNLSETVSDKQTFLITITAIAKGSFLQIDAFKSTFKLINKTAMHEKLIEIFSFRNDISQRRSIIEEMFHLLFSKHRFEVPKHLILRKQEELLFAIKNRPDYQAYRSHSTFNKHVSMLAEKQLKEEILIDQIAMHEKIKAETRDIAQYLNLLSNPRLKEFLYFRSFLDSADDYPAPIHHSTLQQICHREKTLNHIIYHLTR